MNWFFNDVYYFILETLEPIKLVQKLSPTLSIDHKFRIDDKLHTNYQLNADDQFCLKSFLPLFIVFHKLEKKIVKFA